MFCTNCGKEIEHTVAFCPNCGSPVKSEPIAQRQPQPQPSFSQASPLQDQSQIIQACPKCGSSNILIAGETEKGKYWWVWLVVAALSVALLVSLMQKGAVGGKATQNLGRIVIFAAGFAAIGIVQRVRGTAAIKAKCNQCGKKYEFKKNR